MRRLLCSALILLASGMAAAENADVASALTAIREGATESKSDAVLVMQGDQVLLEQYQNPDSRLFELMSVTKSVVALAIGALVTDGLIQSLDMPVAELYPEWKQGRKAKITVRMLMNHTSGLQDLPNTSIEIYPSPNFVQLALAAELSSDPGAEFFYSNKAMNLLAGVVEKASGQRMDVYVKERLFNAMDIEPGPWTKDQAGNPHSMAGLPLSARDLAKIGRLVLDRGRWGAQDLIAPSFVDEMLAASPKLDRYGLLWWRVPESQHYRVDAESFQMLKDAGVDADSISVLRPLDGREFDGSSALYQAVLAALGQDGEARWQSAFAAKGVRMSKVFHLNVGPIVAYEGNGYLGQYLVIVPKADLIAVRQIASRDDYQPSMGYEDFHDRVLVLARALAK
ncbi:6-aminohexanoate hydrolase [Ahniella affigens]|uniref:6-aminohexanoate hydrolase n=1 Tax=Ahniella affigens TaxID=2021234 RepID=A0A2P1PMJ7_9GAMM|nr:serine hydrolase [Ahniella affigens]AVP96062.1 6-aminohexanoate hydrolase [Ahniella affigens]